MNLVSVPPAPPSDSLGDEPLRDEPLRNEPVRREAVRDLHPSRARLLLELACGAAVSVAGVVLSRHAGAAAQVLDMPAATAWFPAVYGVIGGLWGLKAAYGLLRPPTRLRLDAEGLHARALWPPPQRLPWDEVAGVRICRLPLAGQIVFVDRRQPRAGTGFWRRLAQRAPLVIDARSLSLSSRDLVGMIESRAMTHVFREV